MLSPAQAERAAVQSVAVAGATRVPVDAIMAMAGVMNIVSRSGGALTHGDLRIEGGGLGMVRGVAGIGGGLADNRLSYSGSVS